MNKTIEDKLNEGRQYRNIDVSAFERQSDNNEMRVSGYASTFNEPYELWSYDGYTLIEQIDPHAFDETDMEDTIMQYDHQGRVFARVSNDTLKLDIDDHGLRVEARLDGTEIGRQLFEEIEGGYTTKMSFGFKTRKAERKEERDEETGKTTVHRRITEIKKLYDVSAVSLPANDATEISARNIGEGVIAEVKEEFLAVEARKRKKDQIAITAKSI